MTQTARLFGLFTFVLLLILLQAGTAAAKAVVIVGNSWATDQALTFEGGGLNPTRTNISDMTDKTDAVAVGDWDGDGDMDLVSGSADGDWLFFFLKDDNGQWVKIATFKNHNVQDFAVGDIDGDLDLDVAAAGWGGNTTWYRNNGNNTFTRINSNLFPEDFNGTLKTNKVALGDIDFDGDLDLVQANENASDAVYKNDGKGNFSLFSTLPLTAGVNSRGLDLHLRKETVNNVPRTAAHVILGMATTNTGGAQNVVWNALIPGNPIDKIGNPSYGYNKFSTNSIALGDVDGDGDLDMLIGNGRPGALQHPQIYFNRGGWWNQWCFEAVKHVDSSGSERFDTRAVAFVDIDGDSDLDFIAANHGNYNRIYENNGITFDSSPVTGVNIPGSQIRNSMDLAVYYSADVRIDVIGLEDESEYTKLGKMGMKWFSPSPMVKNRDNPDGVTRTIFEDTKQLSFSAPTLIKIDSRNYFYQLVKVEGTGNVPPLEIIKPEEYGIEKYKEYDITRNSTVTWYYEKAYSFKVDTIGGDDHKTLSTICSDTTDAESCADTKDPIIITTPFTGYYKQNTNIIATTMKTAQPIDTQSGQPKDCLSSSITGAASADRGEYNGRKTVLVTLTRNTTLSWNYEEITAGKVGTLWERDTGASASKKPEIKIIVKGPDNEAATVENSFFWTNGNLYPVRPLKTVKITWKNDKDEVVSEQHVEFTWPDTIQKHILGAPVNLDAGADRSKFKQLHYSEAVGGIAAVKSGVFNPEKGGKYVLRFAGPSGTTQFAVVDSVKLNSELDTTDTEWEIGKEITNSAHRDPEDKNGFVVNETAYFDGSGSDKAYNRNTREGQIFPVNQTGESSPADKQMIVVWYQEGALGIGWPVDPVRYQLNWPDNPKIIDIASGKGSDTLSSNEYAGMVYNQPDPSKPGFNPNEEHALIMGNTLWAIRNDLNTALGATLSAPYVLLKYQKPDPNDQARKEWAMRVFKVERTDDQSGNQAGTFQYEVMAGTPLLPPPPLNALPAMEKSKNFSGADWHLKDHKNGHWAKAAGSEANAAAIVMHWYYPMQKEFYYPDYNGDGKPDALPGEAVAFLNGGKKEEDPPTDVTYTVSWPQNAPVLNAGETLMQARYGLPDIAGMAAAEVVFDESMYKEGTGPSVKLFAPLAERRVSLKKLEDKIRTEPLEGGLVRFPDLPYYLKSRLFYDTVNDELLFKGTLDTSGMGEHLQLINVMSTDEKETIQGLADDSDWKDAVDDLFKKSRNPNNIDLSTGVENPFKEGVTYKTKDQWEEKWGAVNIGIAHVPDDNEKPEVLEGGEKKLRPVKIMGEPMALSAGMAKGEGWVVLAENNDPALAAAPVRLHIIRVARGPYRGEIKAIKSDNVFDEKLTLRHTGDFAGEPENVYFEWYYKPDLNGIAPSFPDGNGKPGSGWIPLSEGWGMVDTTIEGASPLTLSDNWIMARYYYGHAYPQLAPGNGIKPKDVPASTLKYWSDWAGAPGGQGAMLAEGWMKRVFADLNLMETRVKDFRKNETNTLVSMISQLGERSEGEMALNASPENLNRVGMIQAYETILNRGKDFSIDTGTNYGPANNALLLAASQLATFYTLLGNEAYADAVDPTIGFDTKAGDVGSLMPSIFAFQNQLDSLLEEELTLLRGRDDTTATTRARPVYNRLIWNFTRGIGETAYVTGYNINDANKSGVIDENDAKAIYPQGHGDAWGHYLTAMKYWYRLMANENFTWEPRIEAVLVGGSPVPVDYLDERKFAQTAAAKAKMGAEIVNMTYRKHYVDDPAGQWQGYKDTEKERAWGVDGWARRAGQGAYFDWVVANAILPDKDPNPDHKGISKIDRTTVSELGTIAGQYRNIQARIDESDIGLNPLGLAKGVVPFDLDPSKVTDGKTHFEQIYDRATSALNNANQVFGYTNNQTRILRNNEESLGEFKNKLEDQERDYLNRLIEVFGYPYKGDIGSGGFYPAGYNGPDWVHFMYVDTPDLTGEVENPNQITGYTLMGIKWNCPFTDPALGVPVAGPREVKYHIDSEKLWMKPPTEWGKRRAPGEIQFALSDMIQAHSNFQKSLTEYEMALGDIEESKRILLAKYGLLAEQITVQIGTSATLATLDGIAISMIKSKNAVDLVKGIMGGLSSTTLEAIPKVVGTATDATAPVRAAFKGSSITIQGALTKMTTELEQGGAIIALAKEQIERGENLQLFTSDARFEVRQLVQEMEGTTDTAITKLQECYTLKEVLLQAAGRYRAAVAKGERLLAERGEIRKRAAADVQDYRYQDMGFRIFRNDALQKYRAAFDLAARYAYLAATAYDYETNLLGSESGSGREFLVNIVRQRALGQVDGGEPMVGQPGLADPLARMGRNFEVYKSQLGFNNPQTETNRFSLRSEHFRIKKESGETWQKELKKYRVTNLWSSPEFKRYCRPFVPESAGNQPGLIIPFDTEVTFGRNFFGWPLSGGDSAYDATNFATRIRSVGVWFTGYDDSGLSKTPRVYLVPVGEDILRSPSGDGFNLRRWHVVDQKLPVPFPIGAMDLFDKNWIPVNDTLNGEMAEIRKFSSFRAYHDSGSFKQSETIADSRLIGRSVWNTRWLMIIPGGTLLADPDEGLDTFIDQVTDIKLFFQTYAYSGN